MKRREFIASLAAAGMGAAAGKLVFADDAPEPHDALPRREYRPDGPRLSIIGFGGLLLSGMQQSDANDIVAWAIDRGVNYFDVAPTYGNAEQRLGPALEQYRSDCFLACKTHKRDAGGARLELEASLQTLRTDHFDLYQLHALKTEQDVQQVTAPGGALETFAAARDEGKIKYIGFSAHSEYAAIEVINQFDFDSALFPVNVVCMNNGDFGPGVVEHAQRKDVSLLALKGMAWRPVPRGEQKPYPNCWYQPIDDPDRARLAMSYTLDQPVRAAVCPADAALLMLAVEVGLRYQPLTSRQRETLMADVEGVPPLFTT